MALLLAVLWLSPAAVDPLVVRGDRSELAPHSVVLEDPAGQLGFDDVRQLPADRFRAVDSGGENAGYSSSWFWFAVELRNATEQSSFILELHTVWSAELYDGSGHRRQSGAMLPFDHREIAHRNNAFRIALAPGAATTLWLRLQFTDTAVFAPTLWSEPAFWQAVSDQRLIDGCYYGVLLGLAVYNLFLWLVTRDRNYLRYAMFQLAYAGALAATDKYAFQYLWPDHPVWAARSEQVLISLAIAAGLVFVRGFLEVSRLSRRLDAAMRALTFAALPCAAVGALTVHGALNTVLGVLALATLALISAAAALAARRGQATARIFLVAFAVLIAATLMSVLAALGLVVSVSGFPLMKAGSATEAVLLSLALASRINALTADRERAQRDVLAGNAARLEALRRLVSGVAHEVGNPLNFARGGSDALADQLAAIERAQPGTTKAAGRAHRLVASGLARIKLILDNLRHYLAVGDAEPVATDLAREVALAVELAGERLQQARITVERRIDPSPAIAARPGQLHQVILNLISNAIEAMPDGGTLQISARSAGETVEIAVTDSGPGVPVADRERIFEPFFTTRAGSGGTGLGLAVAREIVMKDGGTIRVEDGEPRGARFVVVLPRQSRPNGAPRPPGDVTSEQRNEGWTEKDV